MAGVTDAGVDLLAGAFSNQAGILKTLGLFTLIIVVYSLFIFYFYRFLARKNIVNLDLSKYNKYTFGGVYRFFAVIFFVIEYLIILPFVTFFWFGILAVILLLFSEGLAPLQILLVAAALVGAIRISSFISEDLARDLAKMIPLAFLGLALTTVGFFSYSGIMEKVSQIPSLFESVLVFLIFIVIIEVVMRVFDSVAGLFRKKGNVDEIAKAVG